MTSVLASLNLPAAIEITEGSSLPQSILDKAVSVKELGGMSALHKLIEDLPELLKRNTDILNEVGFSVGKKIIKKLKLYFLRL